MSQRKRRIIALFSLVLNIVLLSRSLSKNRVASAILTQEIQKIVRCSRKLPHRRDAIGCAYTH